MSRRTPEALSPRNTRGVGLQRRAALVALGCAWRPAAALADAPTRVPILAYHRFGDTVVDSMTVRRATFVSHLDLLDRLHCVVVALADVVAWRLGHGRALPPRTVAITADDAHHSQFDVMAPLLRERSMPATLFVYPSAVSNASYAMRWEHLQSLTQAGFAIGSHTYWHPHLLRERRDRAPADFERFARDQLVRSRDRLQQQLGVRPTLLAWPFGLTDPGLMALASSSGYEAAFGLGNRAAGQDDPAFDLPRHLMVDALDARQLQRRLLEAFDA